MAGLVTGTPITEYVKKKKQVFNKRKLIKYMKINQIYSIFFLILLLLCLVIANIYIRLRQNMMT